ncbi:WD repeat domain phosphoinositide-interacting protein 2-like [Lytechinus variegatus]|uniref:WD repeat domain phosphoinositide-interacting protein 2-like n=1 Tax=Lytechinus variegatus TaxID=7654 RepID=UPI001BB1C141|nr:WD repeat domain phosphoinositide-interacting protein 2-like [Lytechinus variegatus]
MNLANQPSDSNSNLLFVNFNQDYTSLAVGTKTSYRLFSLTSVDKLEQIYEHDSEDICIVERLFSSSLVAVVSLTAPRKLKVCHFKKGTEICNYSYSNTILAVKLNRKRLIVALEESLYVHNIRDMKVLHTIRDTPPNPLGLCALSINNDNCYLAYPGSSQIGEVQIFDTVNLQAVTMISAHNSPLAALAFDTTGTKLATASEKGTVIRVFSIPDGKKLFEFRRGVKRCVSINSLAFSADSIFLCASSNTETVHIFKLEQPKEKPTEEPSTWMGYLGKALMTPANYLPSQVTEVLTQDRAFAIVKLPFSGLKNVCALANISKPRVLVAAADGFIYIYNLDPTDGGDCTLLKQHRLDGQADAGGGGLVGATSGASAGGEGASSAGSEEHSEGAEAKGGALGEQGFSPAPAKTFAAATGGSRNVDLLSSSPHRSPAREPMLPSTVDHRHDDLLVTAATDDNQFSSPGMAAGLNQLRLDDDNEFPPMMQHTE